MDANVEYIHMRKNKPNKNYKSKNHSKFILTYHIIFTCKYRKKLLIKYGEDVKQILPLTYCSKYKVQNGVKELANWTQWFGKPFNIKRYTLDD